MPPIQKLSEELISKIAAGEVIERPFSVVKELVENSIDAGATEILVEVEEGGKKKITVIDNGCGIGPAEIELALESHATSKLCNDDDLFRIKTLGFRGEALSSVAAVSSLTLESVSGQGLNNVGSKLEVEGGKLIKKTASAILRGTRISVERLFFNTPARLKFLKSKETEFSHTASWLESMALCRPDIRFVLKHQGKTEFQARPTDEFRLRIRDVLGGEVAEYARPVSLVRGALSVAGYVTDHRITSTTTRSLFFFVNGRLVKDRTLQHAVMAAYENLLMHHHYPWVILHLHVPPDFVDVNVHPTKSEVKFSQANLVHELVQSALQESLSKGRQGGETPKKAIVSEFSLSGESQMVQHSQKDFTSSPPHTSKAGCFGSNQGESPISPQYPPSPPPPPDFFFPPSLKIIGQAHSTYLVCEMSDKLILIDQHAAHERIGFEALKKQFETGGIQRQQLLIPQTFDLRPSQGEILKKYLGDLEKVGLEVEFFGGNTFILRGIPILLEGTDFISLIAALIESLQEHHQLDPFEKRVHEILETMACHQQVRAGDQLSHEEIQSLIQEMNTTRFADQCPHGRPSVLEVSFHELEKLFKRRI